MLLRVSSVPHVKSSQPIELQKLERCDKLLITGANVRDFGGWQKPQIMNGFNMTQEGALFLYIKLRFWAQSRKIPAVEWQFIIWAGSTLFCGQCFVWIKITHTELARLHSESETTEKITYFWDNYDKIQSSTNYFIQQWTPRAAQTQSNLAEL